MKKEAITHGVLEDLANRNDNWDKLDGVPEKVDLLMESKANKVEVDASLELKANKQQEAWITPTLLNGWANANAAYEPLSYVKDSLGWVRIRGTVSGGTAPIVFNLPLGYRKNTIHMFPINRIENTATYGFVNTNGNVEISGFTGRLIVNVSFYVGF